jgi:hypothetical protein
LGARSEIGGAAHAIESLLANRKCVIKQKKIAPIIILI